MSDLSLSEIAELVGIEVDEDLRADFWPHDDGQLTRFVDHKTNSRIKIVVEKTD